MRGNWKRDLVLKETFALNICLFLIY
jgi:hypothetical protein